MKKLVLAFVLFIGLLLVCIYIFIPQKIEIGRAEFVNSNFQAVKRKLMDVQLWTKWWPGLENANATNSYITFRQTKFHIAEEKYNGYAFETANGNDSLQTILHLIPLPGKTDSALIEWSGTLETSANPLSRIQQFLKAKKIQCDIDSLLSHLASFMSKQENLYGMKIERVVVQDTLLVYEERKFATLPSTLDVYSLVRVLQNKIKTAGLQETNYPMLNILKIDSTTWKAMVAIPINKQFANADLSFRKMIKGYILVGEIKGGQYNIQKGIEEMSNFVSDYSKVPIAMPFESLVTDRSTQPDSSQWITRLYFPVVL
jgi:hypothetical protein